MFLRVLPLLLIAPLAWASPTGSVIRRTLLHSYETPSATEIPVAFFDADGTLRPTIGKRPANDPSEVVILPDVALKLASLAQQGYFIAIVSNQAGIPQFITLEMAEKTLFRTVELITQQGGRVHYMDFAEGYNDDRKPGVGMGQRLERFLRANYKKGIDRSRSIMVGDAAWAKNETRPDGRPGFNHSNADRLFAVGLGISFFEATDFFGWKTRFGVDGFDSLKQLNECLEALQTR